MFVVYDVETKHVMSRHPTSRGALISVAAQRKRLVRRAEKLSNLYKETTKQRKSRLTQACEQAKKLFVSTLEDFNTKIDEEVEVLVTIGGPPRKVKIRKSEQGGCCDPSTETYWTM